MLLIRRARIVPVTGAAPAEPVDVLVGPGAGPGATAVLAVTPASSPLGASLETTVIDADGRWLIPGLWDHHVHFAQWARTVSMLDLVGATDATEVCRRVAAAGSDDPVLMGFGYRSGAWPAQPSVAQLDAVSGERPVVLIAGDAHNGWLNSAALRLLDIPPRDTVLEEYEWFPVLARLDELPRDAAAEEAAYARAVRHAAARGIVGITDLEFGGYGVDDWPARLARGIDQLRVRVGVYPDQLYETLERGLRTGDPLASVGGSPLVTMGPLKVIADGSLNTRTAYCHHPYAAPAPADTHGRLNVTRPDLTALMRTADEGGLRMAVHAIGDAALGEVLSAFEASGARGSVEHAQLVDPADLPRLGRLGLVASVQPAHLLDDRDTVHACWPGSEDRCFPLRSLLDQGVPLTFGSDAPVAPLDPWLAMAASVHRAADERDPWNPAESLTAREALASSTDGAGTVAVGSRADLVLVDADPLAPAGPAQAAGRLRGMGVAWTIRDGQVTHDQGGWGTMGR